MLIIFLFLIFLKKWRFFPLFIFGLFISLSAVIYGREMWYLLYLQPFLTIIVLSLLKKGEELFPKNIFVFFYFFVSFSFCLNLFIFCQNFWQIKNASLNYHQFAQKITDSLPKKGKIFLAVIPDPYFDLQKNEKLELYEFPTVPFNPEVYKNFLLSMDYFVVNYPSDKILLDLVNRKKEKKLIKAGGYSAFLIKVKK